MHEALHAAMRDEMEADPDTLLLGEALSTRGGASKLTYGFEDAFGPKRAIETPISENALIGGAFGAALAGARVICEVYSADFVFCGGSEIFNDLAKWRYEHQYTEPIHLLLRMPMGSSGVNAGPEHTQSVEAYLHHAPGLRVVVPSDARSAYESLRGGLRCGDPVLLLEHRNLYHRPSDDLETAGTLGSAWRHGQIVRGGSDATIVAWGRMRSVAEEAAEKLEADGFSAEVVDPISVKPLPYELIASSLERTQRLVVVEEAPRTGSVSAEIMALTAESFPTGQVQMRRVTMPDVHNPYHSSLEPSIFPVPDKVVIAAKSLF